MPEDIYDNEVRLTVEEWNAARQQALDDLGVTYEELERQHEECDFDSVRHKILWHIIGATL